jgi:chromosomal replication initiator protein
MRANPPLSVDAIRRLIAVFTVVDRELGLTSAIEAVVDEAEIIKSASTELAANHALIIEATARIYGVRVADIKGPSRAALYSRPRNECFWLLRRKRYSYRKIGEILGGRDHSTVIHGIKKFEKRIADEPLTRRRLGLE